VVSEQDLAVHVIVRCVSYVDGPEVALLRGRLLADVRERVARRPEILLLPARARPVVVAVLLPSHAAHEPVERHRERRHQLIVVALLRLLEQPLDDRLVPEGAQRHVEVIEDLLPRPRAVVALPALDDRDEFFRVVEFAQDRQETVVTVREILFDNQ
jgi:hypothetical protein